MHELSLCGSIADIATRHAEGRAVQTVHLQVGQLRQVVPDTLVYCWGLVVEGTPLAGARLAVEHVRGRVECRACGAATELEHPVFRCSACDGTDVMLVAGEEFLVTSLELAEA